MKSYVFYYFTLLYVSVVALNVKTRRRHSWNTEEGETSPLPPPGFRETPDRVMVKQGQMAKLECSVQSLGTKKVIWRRKSDPNPLTIGRRTFVDDERISVEHVPLGPDWHLIIKQVRLDDEGAYECQISSTDRDLRRYVHLSVKRTNSSGTYSSSSSEPTESGKRKQKTKTEIDYIIPPGPEINITGKTYVEKNQKIRLICNATGAGHSPDSLDWFLNGQKLATDVEKKVYIQMQVSLMEKTISSILDVEDADMDDAGIYVCRTSDLQIASTRVDVLNADTNNVKRERATKKYMGIQTPLREQSGSRGQRCLPHDYLQHGNGGDGCDAGTEKDTTSEKSDSSKYKHDSLNQHGNQAVRQSITFYKLLPAVLLTMIFKRFQEQLLLPT